MPYPDEDLEDEDEGEDESADSDAEGGEPSGTKDPKPSDKRIRDLQSEKDKETARANKAEKQLKALLDAAKDPDAESSKPPANGNGGSVADNATLDMARMFVFQMNPALAEYGIPASALTGDTPSEIAESATELVAQFKKIETRMRNKVLAEMGHAPEIEAGAAPPKVRDYSKMSKEDFQKVVDEAIKGR